MERMEGTQGAQGSFAGGLALSKAEVDGPLAFHLLVARQWKRLVIAALLGGLLAAGVDRATPAWYRAEAKLSVLPHGDPIMQGGGNAMDEASANLPVLAAVLHSRAVGLETISQLKLDRIYRSPSVDVALVQLWSHVFIASERKANMLTVAAEDRDPARARDLAATLAKVASEHNADLWRAGDRERRQKIEARIAEVTKVVAADEEALRVFREKENVINLEQQVRASVAQAAALQGRVSDKAVALRDARAYAGSGSAEVSLARAEVRSVEHEVASVIGGTQSRPPFVAMERVPALELADRRLRRALDMDSETQALLSRQLEQLKVAETRAVGRADLVDEPSMPLYRSRPGRAVVGMAGALGGLLLALIVVAAGGGAVVGGRRRALETAD